MMFPFLITVKWNVHEALQIGGRKQERAFNKVVKKVLGMVALHWHKVFIKQHFTREAYTRYEKDYPEKKKKGQRKPFVHTGSLRDRICSRKGPQHLSGTPSRINLTMKIGRPKRYSKGSLDKQSAALQKATGMSKKDADKQVFSGKGYGSKNIKAFQKGIPATNSGVEKVLSQYMAEQIVKEINKGDFGKTLRI